MLKYNKKGEGPGSTGGPGNPPLNKMKSYQQLDWRNYKPNMKVAKLAADEVARQLNPENPLEVLGFYYDQTDRRYIAFMMAKLVRSGEAWKIVEIDGHYYSVTCKFTVSLSAVQLSMEEIDYGHYHRYSHLFNGVREVCEDCPENVTRKVA